MKIVLTRIRNIIKIRIFIFIFLINIGCKKSSQPKEILNKIISYDSIEITNDGYEDVNGNYKKLKLARENSKIGFLYENGDVLFPCIFDSIVDVQNNSYNDSTKSYFSNYTEINSYAKVKKEGKWGLISKDGKVILSFKYDDIYVFDYNKTSRMEGPYLDFLDYDGKAVIVKKDGKWGLVNTKEEVLAECVYNDFFITDVRLFYENRAAAKKDRLWGFLNEKGKPISSFIYDSVGSYKLNYPQNITTFNEKRAIVKKDGKWGVIDLNGNEVIAFIYDFISVFDSETTIAKKDGKWGYINNKGEEVIPIIYDEIKWFELGLCPAKKDGLWGFLNEKGEVVVPMIYEDILISEEVAVDGGLWFFSQDRYCALEKNGKWGLLDKDNNTIINFEYDKIKFTSEGLEDWNFFSNGFLSVQKGKFWSSINKKGINYIPFEYDDIMIWSEGNVCIKKNSKWGLLDSLGRQLVPIEHKNAMDAGNFNYKKNN